MTCDAHFRTWTCYSSQKSSVKIWFGLVEIRGMLSLRGPEDPLLVGGGGLHVNCDAHFRTRMCYSSQKSCMKIWFGLVEIGGVHFRGGGGGRNPLLGDFCDAHLRTWPSYSSEKSCVKIWFGLVEPFKSYRVHRHPKKKKKKKITDTTEYNIRPFRAYNNFSANLIIISSYYIQIFVFYLCKEEAEKEDEEEKKEVEVEEEK